MKPQDLVVVLKLADVGDGQATYPWLAAELGLSASEAHSAVKRAARAGLLDDARKVRRAALLEFLVHGAKYVFPPQRSALTRGVPTSLAAPPLKASFGETELPPVWPHPEGTVRGEGLLPIYRSVPDAARRDPKLYEWLALLDAVRAGRARERGLAVKELERRLS
ncbi:MAG: hypothetical protein JNK04_19585 [Myxococcales bacterium]|nr:hypothetical protein [Myxococcales bacterium]